MDQTITESGTSCVNTLMSISHFINSAPNNLSLISSDPSRVCICEDNRPQCLEYTRNVSVYPGQTFNISAYVVGQYMGTTKGIVYAKFLNKSPTAHLNSLEYSQIVGQHLEQTNVLQTDNRISYSAVVLRVLKYKRHYVIHTNCILSEICDGPI